MKIEFKKITAIPKHFSLDQDGVTFSGEIVRIDQKLYKITATLNGALLLICDKTGEEYQQQIQEDLVLYVSNGIWDAQSQKIGDDFDIIEFFDGFVDFGYILQSEIESIQLEYHTKEGD